MKRIIVACPNWNIKNPQNRIANPGTSGTAGQRKARGRSGCFTLNTITATEIKTNADNVPMFTNLASSSNGMNAPNRAATIPKNHVALNGVRYFS